MKGYEFKVVYPTLRVKRSLRERLLSRNPWRAWKDVPNELYDLLKDDQIMMFGGVVYLKEYQYNTLKDKQINAKEIDPQEKTIIDFPPGFFPKV